MKIGVSIFLTDYAIPITELAPALEERGFESLFLPEHTHIPKSRRSPWPGGPNLPKEYWHTFDPFVVLATAAAVTRRLRVGTGICLVIERDPITTAKQVASLDVLSGGRFIFGIGGGGGEEGDRDKGGGEVPGGVLNFGPDLAPPKADPKPPPADPPGRQQAERP